VKQSRLKYLAPKACFYVFTSRPVNFTVSCHCRLTLICFISKHR